MIRAIHLSLVVLFLGVAELTADDAASPSTPLQFTAPRSVLSNRSAARLNAPGNSEPRTAQALADRVGDAEPLPLPKLLLPNGEVAPGAAVDKDPPPAPPGTVRRNPTGTSPPRTGPANSNNSRSVPRAAADGTGDSPPLLQDGSVNLDGLDESYYGAGDEYFESDADSVGWQLFNGLYVRGEWLLWNTSGMYVPPLVTTTAQTARAGAGALGDPDTTVLFGDPTNNNLRDFFINNSFRSGARITFGTWLDYNRQLALEGEYFGLADERTQFSRTSTGNPILARPFFNILTGQESAELVAFPGVLSGTVSVDAVSRFQGAGGRLKYAICQGAGCAPSWADPCDAVPVGYRVNLLGGYRFLRLDDSLTIREQLTTQNIVGGAFDIRDSFDTENQFHGGEVGALLEMRRGRWSLEMLSKVALGATHQNVRINGQTTTTDNGVVTVENGGILAASGANMGAYSRTVFAVAPEVGLNLGFQFLPNWRVLAGYSFLYLSRVVRAGDQIDLDVNPNLFPTPVANPGALRPRFTYVDTDFWAQGLNVGLEGRW